MVTQRNRETQRKSRCGSFWGWAFLYASVSYLCSDIINAPCLLNLIHLDLFLITKEISNGYTFFSYHPNAMQFKCFSLFEPGGKSNKFLNTGPSGLWPLYVFYGLWNMKITSTLLASVTPDVWEHCWCLGLSWEIRFKIEIMMWKHLAWCLPSR